MELLIKYGNLEHLKINDYDLNLVQYLCLDVLAFYLLIFLIILGSFFWAIRVTMMGWLDKTRLRPAAKTISPTKKKAA